MLYPMYFNPLSPQQANPMLYGLSQGSAIAGQNQQNAASALQNQLLSAQIPYASQLAQADLAIKQAQAPYMQSMTDLNIGTLPYLGYKFMAPMLAAQARLAQAGISNANSFRSFAQTPQGAATLAADPTMANTFNQAMRNSAGMINQGLPGGIPGNPTQNSYTDPSTLPVLPGGTAGLSPQPLNAQQINQLKQLAQPGIPPSPAITNAIQNRSDMLAQKKTTDSNARQRNLFAANIEKTLASINTDDLVQYAGRPFSKFANEAVAPWGKESTNYDNYMKSYTAAQLLATQVRQFYGDSIQPSMIQRLEQLTNSATWRNNPALAKLQLDQTISILQKEMGTYREAMQGTAPYKTGDSGPPATNGYQVKGRNGMITLTDDDIAHTAQKHGLSVAQVKQQLGIA